jgi:hypothetical protein
MWVRAHVDALIMQSTEYVGTSGGFRMIGFSHDKVPRHFDGGCFFFFRLLLF